MVAAFVTFVWLGLAAGARRPGPAARAVDRAGCPGMMKA